MVDHEYLEDGKYYIPHIEDFCIGYECEVNWNAAYEATFDPFKVLLQDEDFIYTDDLERLCIAADDGYAHIRTKYLDKEDIESLGWNYIEGSFGTFYKNTYYLQFDGDDGEIYIDDGDYEYPKVYFHGKCPSINELKKIMKLIGV